MIVITEGKENLNSGSLNERETDYISELPKKKKKTLDFTCELSFLYYGVGLFYLKQFLYLTF